MDMYIGSIPFKWKEKDLEELFRPYCALTSVKIIKDKITRQNKGFGFVTVEDESSCINAINALNNLEIEGRKITVSVSIPHKKGEENKNNTKRTGKATNTQTAKPKKKLPPWQRKEY